MARLGLWARLRGDPRARAAARAGAGDAGCGPSELEKTLEQLLDDLGSAHRRPFQNS